MFNLKRKKMKQEEVLKCNENKDIFTHTHTHTNRGVVGLHGYI